MRFIVPPHPADRNWPDILPVVLAVDPAHSDPDRESQQEREIDEKEEAAHPSII